MAQHNEIGKKGEDIATIYLKDKNFIIIERNYHCRGGEIDIIAVKDKKIHFVEVKTKKISSFKEINDMSFRPENNISHEKRKRLLKAIRNYLNYRKIDESKTDIDIMGLIVFLNTETKQAKIKVYDKMIL
jgi:putative endonuclease